MQFRRLDESVSAEKPKASGVGVLAVCALLYALVCTFPGGYNPIQPGLDGSWMYGLSYLAGSAYVYGRDVAFTYGPLGFLLNPIEVGACLIAGMTFWTVLHLCLFGGVAARLRAKPVRLLMFCSCYVLLIGLGLWQGVLRHRGRRDICAPEPGREPDVPSVRCDRRAPDLGRFANEVEYGYVCAQLACRVLDTVTREPFR